jgi:oxygen-dependent protoporphyrinogen oxidase
MTGAVDVVIVGGGIAGLAAAYELSRRGVSCVVLERAARAGGVIFSEVVDGFTIDGGPDSLLVQKPAAIALCQEIGLGDRLVPTNPPRLAYIQRAGRLHALPAASVLGIPTRVGPFVRSSLFSWQGKLRMGAELFIPRRKGDDADESIGAFIGRRFGREAVTYLGEPLLAGIHAGDVDRLSVRALFPQFVEAERAHGSLLRAFRRRSQPGAGNVDGAFRSLPGGLSEMVDALVRALPAGSVRLGVTVTGIRDQSSVISRQSSVVSHQSSVVSHQSSRFVLDTIGSPPIEARAVILAAPAFVTGAVTREYDAELSRLCGEIPYASSAAVVLAFGRDAVGHPLNGSGFVVPRVEGTGILATSWLSSKWPHRAPDDRVLLRAFVGGARDPQALERTDPELVAQSLAALTPLLGIRAQPLLARVYRWERANAQHEVGHLARMAAIERTLLRHPGLYLTGSGFRGVGIPDCIADARATAKAVADLAVGRRQSPVSVAIDRTQTETAD